MSPGTVITETPCIATACWIAADTTRGDWAAVEIISE